MSKNYKFIKYYKGESKNPFSGKDQNKAMLWFCERAWKIDMDQATEASMESGFLGSMLLDYISVGLVNFNDSDKIPLLFKAYLFNRFTKGSMASISDNAAPFREFYNRYYQ